MSRVLTPHEVLDTLHGFEHTAFRLELQPTYLEPQEAPIFEAFLRGDPEPPANVPELQEWYRRVRGHVQQGKRIERVRVHLDQPTDYQRFERWLDQWNREAGEVMRYLTAQRAHEVGLLPAAGNTDWWLLDSSRLIAFRFDEQGHRIQNELITDPAVVIKACKWRDLAVHHSVLADNQDVAA
jgi:phytoene dehydrogenase-like protein